MKDLSLCDPTVIAFDLFGTLVKMSVKHHPYMQAVIAAGLDREIIRRRAMTEPLSFDELFCAVPATERKSLKGLLAAEVASITPFPEVCATLERLHDRGYRLSVISNLAAPYVEALECLPRHLFVAEVMSFEVGTIKPEAAIYEVAAGRMKVQSADMLMVGDQIVSDVTGALAVGVGQALWLNRRGRQTSVPSIKALDELLPLLERTGR